VSDGGDRADADTDHLVITVDGERYAGESVDLREHTSTPTPQQLRTRLPREAAWRARPEFDAGTWFSTVTAEPPPVRRLAAIVARSRGVTTPVDDRLETLDAALAGTAAVDLDDGHGEQRLPPRQTADSDDSRAVDDGDVASLDDPAASADTDSAASADTDHAASADTDSATSADTDHAASADTDHAELTAARRQTARVGDGVEKLRERVAALRGALQATKAADGETEAASASLREAVKSLTEAEADRIAADQRLSRQSRRVRERRSALRRRLRARDERRNRAREARGHLGEAVYDELSAAMEAVERLTERGPASSGERPAAFEGDRVAAHLAAIAVADTAEPVVVGVEAFTSAAEAAELLGAPVVLLH
jgi:hypothetical protein